MRRTHPKYNQQCAESACVLSGCYAWCVGHLARDASNVCTRTHQSELVQGLLGSTSQLGDMPGLQSTQAGMPSGELLLNLTLTWALEGSLMHLTVPLMSGFC